MLKSLQHNKKDLEQTLQDLNWYKKSKPGPNQLFMEPWNGQKQMLQVRSGKIGLGVYTYTR